MYPDRGFQQFAGQNSTIPQSKIRNLLYSNRYYSSPFRWRHQSSGAPGNDPHESDQMNKCLNDLITTITRDESFGHLNVMITIQLPKMCIEIPNLICK